MQNKKTREYFHNVGNYATKHFYSGLLIVGIGFMIGGVVNEDNYSSSYGLTLSGLALIGKDEIKKRDKKISELENKVSELDSQKKGTL